MSKLVWLLEEGKRFTGTVCVLYQYEHHTDPTLVSLYWPVTPLDTDRYAFARFPEIADGKAADLRDCGSGVYDLYRGNGTHVTIRLLQLGQTKAIKITEEAIPCPKVRSGIETRWTPGRGWQKYLKSKGWVLA